MSSRTKINFFMILCVFALILSATSFFSMPSTTYAETFLGESRTDDPISPNFTMTMTATSRQNTSLPRTEKMDETGTINYLCFQWRDLYRLNFRINATPNPELVFGNYTFKVTHFGDDKLVPLLDNDPEILYQGEVGDFSRLDFYYFVDEIINEDSTGTNSAGHGFGLYKFDFVYNRLVSGQFEEFSLGESIYVAVLPDTNIEELISNQNLGIVYSVSSSNHMVNVFNLSLSRDVLKYVKPDRITWIAYGTGTDHVNYCLTQKMKDLDVKRAGDIVIWEKYDEKNMHGTSFLLSTNEIEGIWAADCIIKNAEGDVILNLKINNLSTIKVPPKNYVWLILLIICILILLIFIIAMIFIWRMKKKEKVW